MGPYNSNMEVQLNKDLDSLAEAYETLDNIMREVSSEPPSMRLECYAAQLAKRYVRLSAPVNEVEELPGAIYSIKNYNYKMYSWFMERDFQSAVITPASLYVQQGDLTPEERRQFRKRLR